MKPCHMLFVCSVCVFRRVLTAGRTSSTPEKMVRTTSCPTESVIATAMTWSMPNPSSLATEVHKHTNKPTQTHLHTLSNGLFFHCFRTPHRKKMMCFFDSSKIEQFLKCNFPNFNSYLNQYLALDYRSSPTVWILSRFPLFHVCLSNRECVKAAAVWLQEENGVIVFVCPNSQRVICRCPCFTDHQRKFGEDYGSCQAGISNFLTEVSVTETAGFFAVLFVSTVSTSGLNVNITAVHHVPLKHMMFFISRCNVEIKCYHFKSEVSSV